MNHIHSWISSLNSSTSYCEPSQRGLKKIVKLSLIVDDLRLVCSIDRPTWCNFGSVGLDFEDHLFVNMPFRWKHQGFPQKKNYLLKNRRKVFREENIPKSQTFDHGFRDNKKGSLKKITGWWFQVSTPLKNISQIGSFPQVGVEIENIWVATTQITSDDFDVNSASSRPQKKGPATPHLWCQSCRLNSPTTRKHDLLNNCQTSKLMAYCYQVWACGWLQTRCFMVFLVKFAGSWWPLAMWPMGRYCGKQIIANLWWPFGYFCQREFN